VVTRAVTERGMLAALDGADSLLKMPDGRWQHNNGDDCAQYFNAMKLLSEPDFYELVGELKT